MKVYTQGQAQEPLTVWQRFALGCVSGAVAHAAFYPLEVSYSWSSTCVCGFRQVLKMNVYSRSNMISDVS